MSADHLDAPTASNGDRKRVTGSGDHPCLGCQP
jgi:hypothetical protein